MDSFVDDWDLYVDEYADQKARDTLDLGKPKKIKTWITKDGYELKIKKMTTPHIFNCLALLARKNENPWERPEYEAFLKELHKRGSLQHNYVDCSYNPADGMCPNCVTPWKCNGPHKLK